MPGGARQCGEKSLDEGAGFGAGAIVRNQDFSRRCSLVTKSGQTELQWAAVVVGADDDGDFFWIDHFFVNRPEIL